MDKGPIRIAVILLLFSMTLPHAAGAVVVESAEELRDAIRSDDIQPPVDLIEFSGVIELDRLPGSPDALPAITNRTLIIRGLDGAELRATGTGFRLIRVLEDGFLNLENLTVSGFSTDESGGVVLVAEGDLTLRDVVFRDNHSGFNGGAVFVRNDRSGLEMRDSRFEDNTAENRGGALHLRGTDFQVDVQRTRFVDNQAGQGCAMSFRKAQGAQFRNNVFRGACDGALMDAALGRQGFLLHGNTFVAQGGRAFRYRVRAADNPMTTGLSANILVQDASGGFELCHRVGNGGEEPYLRSFGDNVATDTSCQLDQESDTVVAEAAEVLENPPDPAPLIGGPAVDAAELPTSSAQHPHSTCDASDVSGLGRPQDGDGNGTPECDIGAIELQDGPDIGPAQSGAYFDPARPGEGYFVEVLDGGRAWVTMFSYAPVVGSPPTPKNPDWYFGTGRVVGNSIVVPMLFSTGGTRFGDDFDPDDVFTFEFAEVSLVFPDCMASMEQPGGSYLRGTTAFTDVPSNDALYTEAVRLTSIVPCGQQSAEAPSGRSGNFYDPERPGEGIEVQWLPDGRVLVIWYTFGLNNRPLWLISDGAEVDGNTVTAPMIYPAEPTGFGSDFNPDEIELEPWGTLMLQYTDCDHVELSYESQVEGYGSGSFDYVRLAQPAGTECEPF